MTAKNVKEIYTMEDFKSCMLEFFKQEKQQLERLKYYKSLNARRKDLWSYWNILQKSTLKHSRKIRLLIKLANLSTNWKKLHLRHTPEGTRKFSKKVVKNVLTRKKLDNYSENLGRQNLENMQILFCRGTLVK